MKQRSRIYYTDSQKALMWERWRKGESLQKIAELFDRNHSSVQRILAEPGGICPPKRCRSRLSLTLTEREEISRAVVAGQSIRSIAATSKLPVRHVRWIISSNAGGVPATCRIRRECGPGGGPASEDCGALPKRSSKTLG